MQGTPTIVREFLFARIRIPSEYSFYMSKNLSRYLIGLLSFWLLAGIIPVFTVAGLRGIELGFLPFMAFLIVMASSLRLAVFSIQNDKRIISMTFWIFVYVFLGLTPFLQLLSNHLPLEGSYMSATITTTFLIIFYGLISFEFGWWLGCNNSTPAMEIIKQFTICRYISLKRTVLLSILAIIGIIIIIWKLGGLESVFLSREEQLNLLIEFSKGESQARLQILSTLLRVPIFIALIFLSTIWLHERKQSKYYGNFNLWKKILLLVMLVINLFINNPVSSPRYWFGTIVLSLIFLTLHWRSKMSFSFLMTAIVLLLLFVFPFADMFRSTTNIDKLALQESNNISNPLVNKSDYDSFQQILNTTEYVEDHGIAFGKQMFGTLMFWVPRNLWSSKPAPSGVVVAEYKGYEYTNLSMPLWGEAYMDGGILGVIFIFMIYGFIVSVIENIYINNYFNVPNLLNTFVPVYAAYQLFMLRGTLMSAFAYFMPIVIFLFIATKRENGNNIRNNYEIYQGN